MRGPMLERPGRAVLVVAVIAALSLAGCGEQSRVDPSAAVTVSGTVHDVDESPLADRPVRLGSGVSLSEGSLGVLTVGLFCLGGVCSGDVFDATTGDDGSYVFDLTGSDTQSSFGEAESFLLSTSAEPDATHAAGPAVAARFQIQTEELELPVLRLIDPGLSVSSESADLVAQWDASTAPGPYTVAYVDPEGVSVWEQETATGSAASDGRVLEDAVGQVTVTGSQTHQIEGSDLVLHWRSSSLGFRGGFGPPPSRGSTCEALAADGTTEPIDPCELADGEFAAALVPSFVCPPGGAEPPTAGCPAADRVRIRFPSPIAADLVVVRGCTEACRVRAIGEDGSASDAGPTDGGLFGTVALAGSPLSAVEVSSGDLTELAEISVWAPVPRDQPGLVPVDDRSVVGSEPDLGDDDGLPVWLVVLAALGILAAGVGLGVVMGRRSTATRPASRRPGSLHRT